MVNYTLAAGRLESELLQARSDTGDICVRAQLDRETAPYLEIPVIATDRGEFSFSFFFFFESKKFHTYAITSRYEKFQERHLDEYRRISVYPRKFKSDHDNLRAT